MDKQLPSDVETEAGILAHMILYPEHNKDLKLVPSVFYSSKHSSIYNILTSMLRDKVYIELTSIYNYIKENYKETNITATDLSKIVDVPVPINISQATERLYSLAVRRKIIKEMSPVLNACYNTDINISEVAHNSIGRLQDTINMVTKKIDIFKRQSLADKVRVYINSTPHYTWSIQSVYESIQITNTKDKHNVRQILQRFQKQGLIKAEKKDGLWRKLDTNLEVIDFKKAKSDFFDVMFPLQMDQCRLLPKSICVIAGDQDQGKTAWLFNFAMLNMNRGMPIRYFSSEAGAVETAWRIEAFEREFGLKPDDWGIEMYERSMDFAPVLTKDGINIIDYIEFEDSTFFKVGEILRELFDALGSGIIVAALQKKKGQDLGRGAEFGLEKPRIYLSMSSNPPHGAVIKIIKGKIPSRRGKNPNGLQRTFKVIDGAKLEPTSPWHHYTEAEEVKPFKPRKGG